MYWRRYRHHHRRYATIEQLAALAEVVARLERRVAEQQDEIAMLQLLIS